jgi:RNA polymerase sigma factor (sigma-70 family)
MKDQELIRRIRDGDEEVLIHIYETNRKGFLEFAARFGIEKEDVLDIYQDSIVAFYENARNCKLDFLKSTVTTYIFAIGKYKIYGLLKKNKNEIPLEGISDELIVNETEEYVPDEQAKRLQIAFRMLGNKCREVLTMFYYEGRKLQEIQKKMNYESKDVMKSQKSRCLKKLKELVANNEKYG